jgi:hypothetical protein
MRRATASLLLGLVLASVFVPARVAASTPSATLDVSWTRPGVPEVLRPPESIRVGDTLTVTPIIEGLTSYKCITSLFRDGFDGFAVWATSQDGTTPDGCTPWTVTVAATTPGPVSLSLLATGLGPPEDESTIRAPDVQLSVEEGGSPIRFSSNYPVTSWAPADLLADATPTFGSTLTLAPAATAASDCEFGLNGEWWSTIWSPDEPTKACEPWAVAIPDMRPPWARETELYGAPWEARAEIRGAASDPATGRSLYGATSSLPIPFSGGSATFSSSRPAAVLDHDLNPRHAHPGPYVVTPRLAAVTSGTCRYEWKLPNGDYTQGPEIPVADGSCGTAEFSATDIGVHQFWVYVVDDMGRQITVAAGGVNIDPPMPAPVVEVPADADAGTDVPVDASVSAGAPTGYEVAVTLDSTSIAAVDPADEPASISAAGPACSDATGALDPREGAASITATCRFAEGGRYRVVASFTDAAGVVRSSTTTVDIHVVDATSPAGTIKIAGGAAYTKTTAVTVATAAIDTGSGLSQVALSNNGTTWTTRTYAASQPWTLPATNGTRTVYAKWKDKAGNWSAVKTDTIVLDTVAPTVTAPRRGLVAGTAISSGRITLRVPWSGTDATSGIARYDFAQSTDGGPWTTISTTLTSPTIDRSLTPLHSYRFGVRAIDKAGNVGPWAIGSTFRLSRYSEFNSAIRYSGSWSTVSSAAYWGGAAKRSGTAGARATLTFTGRTVAWVARTGPNRGLATVYVNGTKVATLDLYSATYRNQRVVWARNWSTSATRTVTIRVAGTSGRPLVDVDAFVTTN